MCKFISQLWFSLPYHSHKQDVSYEARLIYDLIFNKIILYWNSDVWYELKSPEILDKLLLDRLRGELNLTFNQVI